MQLSLGTLLKLVLLQNSIITVRLAKKTPPRVSPNMSCTVECFNLKEAVKMSMINAAVEQMHGSQEV